jgi:carbon monoxide dehydrogenase subunit G
MEKYQSKQVQINRPDWMVYNLLSDFNNFTPLLAGKVDNWTVDGETCSFTVKGFALTLRMIERTAYTTVKISGEDGSPFSFVFWIQLVKVDGNDTRMRLTLHAELNLMMKMMIGKKLEQGLDQIAGLVAAAFNMTPDEARRMAEAQGWAIPEVPDGENWPMPDPDQLVS